MPTTQEIADAFVDRAVSAAQVEAFFRMVADGQAPSTSVTSQVFVRWQLAHQPYNCHNQPYDHVTPTKLAYDVARLLLPSKV